MVTAAPKLDPVAARMISILEEIRDELRAGKKLSLTAAEAGELLGCDKERVPLLIKAGLLRGEKDGNRWRIPREDVERLAKNGIPRTPGKRGRPRKPLPKPTEELLRSVPLPPRSTAGSGRAAGSRGSSSDDGS